MRDRGALLPALFAHGRRRGATAPCDPVRARRARMARISPQYVSQRDDAAIRAIRARRARTGSQGAVAPRLGFRLNMFLNVMTPLIMVISFSDSMQLTFAARDRLIAGEDRFAAFRNAVWIVGPAFVLTHATAGLSFTALQFSDSDLIRAF